MVSNDDKLIVGELGEPCHINQYTCIRDRVKSFSKNGKI